MFGNITSWGNIAAFGEQRTRQDGPSHPARQLGSIANEDKTNYRLLPANLNRAPMSDAPPDRHPRCGAASHCLPASRRLTRIKYTHNSIWTGYLYRFSEGILLPCSEPYITTLTVGAFSIAQNFQCPRRNTPQNSTRVRQYTMNMLTPIRLLYYPLK